MIDNLTEILMICVGVLGFWYVRYLRNKEKFDELAIDSFSKTLISSLALGAISRRFPEKFPNLKLEDFLSYSERKLNTIEIFGNFNIKDKEVFYQDINVNNINETYKIILIKKEFTEEEFQRIKKEMLEIKEEFDMPTDEEFQKIKKETLKNDTNNKNKIN